MATFDYNPITGNLDLVGSGASYINGVVADPTALPVTVGTPPLDSVYLAKAGSGVWLINRKPAGLYCRVANNGNAADWTYLGAFPEVNADGNWELYNSTDPTKELKFDLSGLPTATTRTVTAPAGNGQMLVEGQSIGATTRNTIAATTLNANNGTITASAPVLDLAQTWNNAAAAFTGIRLNVTNTASANTSDLLNLQIGGTTQFRIRGSTLFLGEFTLSGLYTPSPSYIGSTGALMCATQFAVGNNLDTILIRDGAAGTLAQRNGTNAQTFRLYNTFTDASNYERGFMRWSSNVLQIGTESGGTGGANRSVAFVVGGTTRATLANEGFYVPNILFSGNASIQATFGSGIIRLVDWGGSSFDRLQFGGGTSSFPALKRSSTALQVRLADDTADAPFSSGAITTSGTVTANNTSSGFVTSSAPNGASPVRFAANTGDVLIQSANAAGIVEFRGTTGTNPQSLRVFNTFTSGTSFERLNIRWATNECIIDAEAGSGGGTLRGIKIGSATSSLLGFYGATPVTQRAAIADATDAATTQARLNDLLAAMRSLGLIAT